MSPIPAIRPRCRVLLMLVFCLAQSVRADVVADFDAANRLYAQGKFNEAAAAYERLGTNGNPSAALCFNRGNALFKQGRIGAAIACYREAQRRSPRDADVRANLQFARNQVTGVTSASPPVWGRALGWLTVNEWTLLATAPLWVVFLLLGLTEWRSAWRHRVRTPVIVCGALALLFGAATVLAWHVDTAQPFAVVVSANAAVRGSPFEESPEVFVAVDGVELRVLDGKDEWLQVMDGQGRLGWVQRDRIVMPGTKRRAPETPDGNSPIACGSSTDFLSPKSMLSSGLSQPY